MGTTKYSRIDHRYAKLGRVCVIDWGTVKNYQSGAHLCQNLQA